MRLIIIAVPQTLAIVTTWVLFGAGMLPCTIDGERAKTKGQ
jgi:hypothetical protein